jgi:hypothetical protein
VVTVGQGCLCPRKLRNRRPSRGRFRRRNPTTFSDHGHKGGRRSVFTSTRMDATFRRVSRWVSVHSPAWSTDGLVIGSNTSRTSAVCWEGTRLPAVVVAVRSRVPELPLERPCGHRCGQLRLRNVNRRPFVVVRSRCMARAGRPLGSLNGSKQRVPGVTEAEKEFRRARQESRDTMHFA